MRGYFSKPKMYREQNKLENTGLCEVALEKYDVKEEHQCAGAVNKSQTV
jgi:hypothetical protein